MIIGGGGHASVLTEILVKQNRKILGILSPEPIGHRKVFTGIEHYVKDSKILSYSIDEIKLVNGIGMLPNSNLRYQLYNHFKNYGYKFESVIDETARISMNADIADDAQVLANSTIQTGVKIGNNSIINSGAIIEHDCKIGDSVHIATGAVISGGGSIGSNTFVGAGSVVIQEISIGESVCLGAGTLVLKDVESNFKTKRKKVEK